MGVIQDWFENENRKSERFGRMVERLAVNVAELGQADHGLTLRRMIGRCRACGAAGQCETWLAGDSRAGKPDFCPNAATFERFAREGA